jgi:hypothetical protein
VAEDEVSAIPFREALTAEQMVLTMAMAADLIKVQVEMSSTT